MQLFRVSLFIWLLKHNLILRIVEKALSQTAVLIGKAKHMQLMQQSWDKPNAVSYLDLPATLTFLS